MRRVLSGVVLWLACASPALAQPIPTDPPVPAPVAIRAEPGQKRPWVGVSVGVGWEKVMTTSGHASNPFPYRFLFRTPLKTGWSPAPMFGWFRSELDAVALGAPDTPMGRVTVRPVLMGIRHTWVRDTLSYDVAAAAGASFNGFSVNDAVRPLLGLGPGAMAPAAERVARLHRSRRHSRVARLCVDSPGDHLHLRRVGTPHLRERELVPVRRRRRLSPVLNGVVNRPSAFARTS
jgi:hypothetical protein